MKNWRVLFLALFILVVSLSCSLFTGTGTTTTGGSKSNQGLGASGMEPKPSGVIDKVTLAKGTQGAAKDPVNPTTVFSTTDTFHAVVHITQAPTATQFKAIWYSVDDGVAAEANKVIDSSDITADGTVNIDFYLTPTSSWPTGTFQVEIYVNGVLDQVENFSVKGTSKQ